MPKNPEAPPSPILWGILDIIEKRLIGIPIIYFERGTTICSVLSQGHFW
ncbi:hypothetical protein NARC_30112 [Candidatus Nitrosocosmicus arcticus]|uniref:Uncharacterized protein n=1 Tax=Candidatus Nitrosocosmicus arcticus TaxID=2035267 RepID=A0A557SXR7_9ARCH|nr:hypothetical protein NARC_30112 [Candidatus Nitrosocosmicus arcticus]